MNKNNLGGIKTVVLIIIGIILAIGFGVGSKYYQDQKFSGQKINENLSEKTTPEEALLDLSDCEILNSRIQRNDCYTKVAVIKKDGRICELVKDIRLEDTSSRDLCYIKMANSNKDESFCANVKETNVLSTTNQNYCYYMTAIAKKDLKIGRAHV